MKIKSQQDFFAGLLFMALGVAFAIGALNYRLGPECPTPDCASVLQDASTSLSAGAAEPVRPLWWRRFLHLSSAPGPGYFPLGLGLLLAVLGGLLVFKALTFEVDGGDRVGRVAWAPLFFVVTSIVAFAYGISRAGFFISAGAAMALAMMADSEVRRDGPWRTLLAALLGTLLAMAVVLGLTPWLERAWLVVSQQVAGAAGWDFAAPRARYPALVLARVTALAMALLMIRWVSAWGLRREVLRRVRHLFARWPIRDRVLRRLFLAALLKGPVDSQAPAAGGAGVRVGALVSLFFVLIAGSVWVFAQGLGLTIPLLPAGMN